MRIFLINREKVRFLKKNSGYWSSLSEIYTKSRKAEIKIFYQYETAMSKLERFKTLLKLHVPFKIKDL